MDNNELKQKALFEVNNKANKILQQEQKSWSELTQILKKNPKTNGGNE